LSGRSEEKIAYVEAYSKVAGTLRAVLVSFILRLQTINIFSVLLGMLRDFDNQAQDPVFSQTYELDLSTVVPSLSGPKRPQGTEN
jgi:hypothetical protein